MKRARTLLLIPAALLIVFSWLQLGAARSGLVIRQLNRDGVPMLYVGAAAAKGAPGVLIAHGFAGSKQLMLAYAYTLAHAGYATLAWDFNGLGANAGRLETGALQANLDTAASVLVEQPEVDPSRLALLGHSMGSGAVMAAGIRSPERYASVVAISPTGAAVTATAPRNLLFQAGSLESGFLANARRLLAQAGGPNEDFPAGKARGLVVIPGAEHISILFRTESHQAALAWLRSALNTQLATTYVDRRIIWYGLHLLGWLLALVAVAPALRSGNPVENHTPVVRRWLGLAVGAAAAVLLLAVAARAVALDSLLGLQVGGFVALWLSVAGLTWLLFVRPIRRLRLADLLPALLLFAFLTVAFGVMGQEVWIQWWLNSPRLWRWPFMALLTLPWFLASAHAQWGASAGLRALWWLGESLAAVVAMFVMLLVVPSVGFLLIIIPVFPLIFGMLAIAGSAFDRPWSQAIGNALFLGWVLAAVFPLV